MRHLRPAQKGTSLIEVMIAAVVVVILALAFMGSVTASFMADASSHSVNGAMNVARATMEESIELSFADLLALDGDTILMSDGFAVRISVIQSSVNLALVEVTVCRPVPPLVLGQLQSLNLEEFKRLPAASGSVFSLVTMKFRG